VLACSAHIKPDLYPVNPATSIVHRTASGHSVHKTAIQTLRCPNSVRKMTVEIRQKREKCAKDETVKGKVFPYSLPSVGPGADPVVQAVSPQVT